MAGNTVGERAHAAIAARPGIRSSELAAELGEPFKRVHYRLRFLEKEEGCVASAGDVKDPSWRIVDGKIPPWERDGRRKGASGKPAKPSKPADADADYMDSLEPFVPGSAVKPRDKLVVRYPERWRADDLVSVERIPDERGVARCWSMRDSFFTYVDLVGFEATGGRVARVPSDEVDAVVERMSDEP